MVWEINDHHEPPFGCLQADEVRRLIGFYHDLALLHPIGDGRFVEPNPTACEQEAEAQDKRHRLLHGGMRGWVGLNLRRVRVQTTGFLAQEAASVSEQDGLGAIRPPALVLGHEQHVAWQPTFLGQQRNDAIIVADVVSVKT